MLMSFHVRGRRSHWLTAALRARRDKKASSHFAITLDSLSPLPRPPLAAALQILAIRRRLQSTS